MVYVRGNTDDDISKFVKKVRFFLDASYKPNDILESTEHPFQITRRGWAQFVIRVQLFFKDPRNKPVSVFHQIKERNGDRSNFLVGPKKYRQRNIGW